MEKKFELETIKSDNGVLEVKNFDKVFAQFEEYVKLNPAFVVKDAYDLRIAKEKRADINTIIKALDRTRIDNVQDLIGSYTEQCKAITTLLDNLQKEYGAFIKAYTDSQKVGEIVGIKKTITITLIDDEKGSKEKKITDLALKLGAEIKIK